MQDKEAQFQLFWTDGHVRMCSKSYEALGSTRQHCTMQAGGSDSIMVWDVFRWYRLVLLVNLNTSLIGDHYIALFQDHLKPFMVSMYTNNEELL